MPQTPVDNTQPSLALTQSFVISGVFPPHDNMTAAGGGFLGEIFTYAFNFSPPGATLGTNGQLLSIAQN
jgi:microcystin-dependent protein